MRLNNQINLNYYPNLFNVNNNETIYLKQNQENLNGFIYQYKYCPKTKKAHFTYVSKGIEAIFDIEADILKRTASPLIQALHRDDVGLIRYKFYESMNNLSKWNLDFRVYIPGKGIVYLRGQGNPKQLEDGSFLWNGYIRDITDMKNNETTNKTVISKIVHRNNELLSIANIVSYNIYLSYEEFKYLLKKSKKTENLEEKRKIISCLKEISKSFSKDKAYIDEIINTNLDFKEE